jgi:hypothetical protein
MVNSLIESTLKEIAGTYQAGTLPWMKRNRPDEWKRLLGLEDRINQAALARDEVALTEALEEYPEFFREMGS